MELFCRALPVFFLVLLTSLSFAEAKKPVQTSANEALLKESEYWINSPRMMDDAIVFFYRGDAQKVVVAGDFNGWRPELLMDRKSTNFFMLAWDERLPKGVYRYKLIIDDVWTSDPQNTNFVLDESGQQLSTFELTADFIPHARYPLWVRKDEYLFRYQNNKARSVYLVGDFNNWNPFSLLMEDKGAGEFELLVRLKPGVHTYCYVVDGEWKADPNNLRQYSDETGAIVSVVEAKAPNQKKKKKR